MLRFFITEHRDGESLDNYEKIFEAKPCTAGDNFIEIQKYKKGQAAQIIRIHRDDFDEFVRQCQKMRATLS